MLVTLTKKVAGDYTGPALKITVNPYIIESIDNFDTGDGGCTLTLRTGKEGNQVTYDCVESHAEASKIWEDAVTIKREFPVPPKKKAPAKKKKVVAKKAPAKKKAVAKKKVVKKKAPAKKKVVAKKKAPAKKR